MWAPIGSRASLTSIFGLSPAAILAFSSMILSNPLLRAEGSTFSPSMAAGPAGLRLGSSVSPLMMASRRAFSSLAFVILSSPLRWASSSMASRFFSPVGSFLISSGRLDLLKARPFSSSVTSASISFASRSFSLIPSLPPHAFTTSDRAFSSRTLYGPPSADTSPGFRLPENVLKTGLVDMFTNLIVLSFFVLFFQSWEEPERLSASCF